MCQQRKKIAKGGLQKQKENLLLQFILTLELYQALWIICISLLCVHSHTDTKPATQHKHKLQLRTPSDHKCLLGLPWVVKATLGG